MSSIRQFNRVHKSKVYWKPSPPTCRQWQPAFTIHANLSEDQLISEDLDMQFPEDLGMKSEDLDMESEDLGMKFKDLDMKFEDLDMKFKDLDMQFSEDLDMKLEDLDMQSVEDQLYQSQFLSKNKADKSQNLSEDSNSLKLFKLFFTVKKMK